MDNREQGSHARGVYPTQDTSRTRTVRVKQEEEERHKNIVMEWDETGKKAPGHDRGKAPNKT